MGRVGRVTPGVYIPCIPTELLELLPESYVEEKALDRIDGFILRFFMNQQ
jgi:hypothetical protein